MRTTLALAVAVALLMPFALADAPTPARAEVRPVALVDEGGADAVSFVHDDCVGPGLPGTAGPHATHTDRVGGFVIDPARPVRFGVVAFTFSGPGVCPITAAALPYLPHDFTGRWSMEAICRGTLNDGAVFFTWTAEFVAGIAVGQSDLPGTCIGYLGDPFALDVTIGLEATSLLGVALGPLGGIRTTIDQS